MTAEEYINDFTRGCSNELDNGEFEYWLTPWQAEAACNLKKEETINKAYEWIKLHIGELNDIYIRSAIRNEFLEDFRKAMEG